MCRQQMPRLIIDAPPGPTFVVALDEALQSARGEDASTLRRGDMVEIIGPTGSGMPLSFLSQPSSMLLETQD